MHKWWEKKYHGYFFTEFNAIKKRHNEYVTKLINRYNKLYNNLPGEIKPPQETTKVVFSREFESDFGFTLRERKSLTLD